MQARLAAKSPRKTIGPTSAVDTATMSETLASLTQAAKASARAQPAMGSRSSLIRLKLATLACWTTANSEGSIKRCAKPAKARRSVPRITPVKIIRTMSSAPLRNRMPNSATAQNVRTAVSTRNFGTAGSIRYPAAPKDSTNAV